ncbi:MarR family winged helix-turn-helix transcriptional regulator [Actinoplanes sp. CA-131856]
MTSETTLSPGEDEVVGALLALSRAFVAETARSLSGLDEDVTLPQFRTLVVLVSQGPQRIVDLANELTVTSSTAVRMCQRLVRKGLVVREERPHDRRTAWIKCPQVEQRLIDVEREDRHAPHPAAFHLRTVTPEAALRH